MALALGTTAVVLIVLLWELGRPHLLGAFERVRSHRRERRRTVAQMGYDPGRERRAEQRARALLQSCVQAEDWAMYCELGFLRVRGGLGVGERDEEAAYAYLIYPHRPIVAYLPATRELLNEYCVAFPDQSKPYGSSRLPDSDDVLAKWMALTGDERRLIADANMHLPGRQIDPDTVRRDLARLSSWERERAGRQAGSLRAA
ncbi:MAG: hypothetical protein JWO23_2852 [Solirubrobacterales bacterium]|nr:hypothetical protein [Solirubrobacterales bacterium]